MLELIRLNNQRYPDGAQDTALGMAVVASIATHMTTLMWHNWTVICTATHWLQTPRVWVTLKITVVIASAHVAILVETVAHVILQAQRAWTVKYTAGVVALHVCHALLQT